MWPFRKKRKSSAKRISVADELIAAKAQLARYKELPKEDFTCYRDYVLCHGVDEKAKVVARQKARVAELQVLRDHEVKETTND